MVFNNVADRHEIEIWLYEDMSIWRLEDFIYIHHIQPYKFNDHAKI